MEWRGGVFTLGCRGVGEYHGGVELLWWGRGVVEGWKCYGRVEVL